jgi:hypothetical protein
MHNFYINSGSYYKSMCRNFADAILGSGTRCETVFSLFQVTAVISSVGGCSSCDFSFFKLHSVSDSNQPQCTADLCSKHYVILTVTDGGMDCTDVLLIERCTGFEMGKLLGLWDLNVLY